MKHDPTLAAIRAQIRELEQQAEQLERANKPGIAQVKDAIHRYKLSREDIELAFALAAGGSRKRGVPKGTQLQPKYRNPNNPHETWAGRGLKPRWLTTLLKQGAKLSDLEI